MHCTVTVGTVRELKHREEEALEALSLPVLSSWWLGMLYAASHCIALALSCASCCSMGCKIPEHTDVPARTSQQSFSSSADINQCCRPVNMVARCSV